MPRVYSRRQGAETPPEGAVYVGRPTQWGNPFVVGRDGTQRECVEKYRQWLLHPAQKNLRCRIVSELSGRDLVCWCSPLPCHADVLLQFADSRNLCTDCLRPSPGAVCPACGDY